MKAIINQDKINKIHRLHDILKMDGFGVVIEKHDAKSSSDCYTYIAKELFDGLVITVFTSHGNKSELKVELSVKGKSKASEDFIFGIIDKANRMAGKKCLSGFDALIVDYIKPNNERYKVGYEIDKVIFQSPSGAVTPVGTSQPFSGYCMQLAKYNKGCEEREVPHVVEQMTRLIDFVCKINY